MVSREVTCTTQEPTLQESPPRAGQGRHCTGPPEDILQMLSEVHNNCLIAFHLLMDNRLCAVPCPTNPG